MKIENLGEFEEVRKKEIQEEMPNTLVKHYSSFPIEEIWKEIQKRRKFST